MNQPPAGALPPASAARLGPGLAGLAGQLRHKLAEVGVALPAWIDARPGLLEVVIGDCAADPPLSRTARTLALESGRSLVLGLGAAGLAGAARRTALLARDADAVAALRLAAVGTQVEVYQAPAAWPSLAELDVPDAAGRSWTLGAQELHRLGAAVQGRPPHRICTVAGAVAAPQVVPLRAGHTPRELVRLCGGALSPAWVALAMAEGQPLYGARCDADEPVPEGAILVLVLPAGHDLVRRRTRPAAEGLRQVASVCAGCRLCSDACPASLQGAPVEPHALLALLAAVRAQVEESPPGRLQAGPSGMGALGCTGCGVCDVVCPAGLGPAGLVGGLRERLRELGQRAERPAEAGPEPWPAAAGQRRLPLALLVARSGLEAYAGD